MTISAAIRASTLESVFRAGTHLLPKVLPSYTAKNGGQIDVWCDLVTISSHVLREHLRGGVAEIGSIKYILVGALKERITAAVKSKSDTCFMGYAVGYCGPGGPLTFICGTNAVELASAALRVLPAPAER
jgi:hypothetical protein